jgi:hypothetical protein
MVLTAFWWVFRAKRQYHGPQYSFEAAEQLAACQEDQADNDNTGIVHILNRGRQHEGETEENNSNQNIHLLVGVSGQTPIPWPAV